MWHAIFGSLPQDNACHNIFGDFCQTSTTWNEHTTLISLIVETQNIWFFLDDLIIWSFQNVESFRSINYKRKIVNKFQNNVLKKARKTWRPWYSNDFSLTHSFTCACDGHFMSLQPLEKCDNKRNLVTKGFKLLAINQRKTQCFITIKHS
jgi:hypothetical protein